MWIAKKAAGRGGEIAAVSIGTVTAGGSKPCVMTEGETRTAELAACPGVYVPAAGDEVLVCRTQDGESVIVGKLSGAGNAQAGEVCIAAKNGGSVVLRSNGDIELTGTMRLVGRTYITGPLIINGSLYTPE